MRIITWNIQSGAGSRISQVLKSLRAHEPDIAVLTEFRNNNAGLEIRKGLTHSGLCYQSGVHAEARVNSVLVAAREPLEERVFGEIGVNKHRCILAKIRQINLFGLYFPQKQAKVPLFEFLIDLAPRYLREQSLLLGDFNTGKHYIDERGATFHCAKSFDLLEEIGWVDPWRRLHPVAREHTWYSKAGNGFRIDHVFVSQPLLPRVLRVTYSHVEREASLSDHSALIVDIE